MPFEDVKKFADSASAKADVLDHYFGKFFLRAVMAGVFVGAAMIFSNAVSNTFFEADPAFGKFMAAIVFSLAVLLIVFVGGELFTGNNFTMAMGAFEKRVSWKTVIRVWTVSYLGNFVGCVLLALLFVLAGAAGTKDYYKVIMDGKMSLSLSETFFRAVMCNFFVCLAVVCGTKCKGESTKFLMIVMCIATFVIAGFEHCVANMANFATALLMGYRYSIPSLLVRLLIATVGNMIGGALCLAWPLWAMSITKTSGKQES